MKLDINSFNSNMVKSLPSFYLAEDIKHDNVLRRYLGSIFIGGADDILKSINHTIDLIDPYKCPTEDLPELFKSWGLRYEPTLEEDYQRKLLANLGEVYRRKGSYSCVRYLVRSITGRDCDVIYIKTESGERRLGVTLISNSLNDIASGEIQKATSAIQKIIPQFLPFYLVPKVFFSGPRGSLEFGTRNLGFRASERVFSDFTFKGLDNLFLNPDFNLGTDLWEMSDFHLLEVTDIKKDSNNCLKSVWTKDSCFYQDIDVHYKDVYSTKAYFMCPTEYWNNPPKITMLLTYYRANGTIAYSVFKTEVELNIKNRWFYLKRNFYVDDPLCVKVRVAYYCSTPNQIIYFSSPQLLRISRVEQLQCADILSVIPQKSGCLVEWSPVMGATEYLIYSADIKGNLEYLGAQSVSNRYIWGNAPLAEEGLKLLVVSTNGHITSDPEPEKCALYYSRCTATGNPIQINDSLEYPLQCLSLYGKSTQGYASSGGTPVGKNLLSNTSESKTIDSVTFTVNSDGTITANGKASANIIVTIGTVLLSAQTDYILSGCPDGGTASTYRVDLRNMDNGVLFSQYGDATNVKVGTDTIVVYKIRIENGTTLTNAVFKPMIRLASISDDTYEPYYSNPNPDCPVDIVSVGDSGSIEVVACGKNLFPWNDYTTAPINGWGMSSGCTYKVTSSEIQVEVAPNTTSTGGGVFIFQRNYVDVISPYYGNTFTISYELRADSEITVRHGFEGVGIYVDSVVGTEWKRFSCSTTIKKPYNICWKTINQPETILYIRKIQIEIGDTATDYEPYKGSTASITTALPLCSVGDVCDELIYNADGTGKIVKHIGKYTFKGTENFALRGNRDNVYTYSITNLFQFKRGAHANVLCDKYNSIGNVPNIQAAIATLQSGEVCVWNQTDNCTIYFGSNCSDLESFKAEVTGATVVYQLPESQEIGLSAAEMAQLRQLQTFESITNISNSAVAEMTIKYCGNQDFNLGGVTLG